eukprot:TRINITY_DN1348_c0_g2_i1.p1 TRINITY_DN1348_c0_g2~~TRINITY_DN1348_c0_g2_i1.p1  ORF type:complete len:902 (-),score=72.16 TRINITY_DN1348_c0_g2_i1:2331-5036(-)
MGLYARNSQSQCYGVTVIDVIQGCNKVNCTVCVQYSTVQKVHRVSESIRINTYIQKSILIKYITKSTHIVIILQKVLPGQLQYRTIEKQLIEEEKMNMTLTNASDVIVAQPIEAEKSWLKYELIMLLIFVLGLTGLTLLKSILYYSRQILNFLSRPRAVPKKEEQDIAAAALKILRQSPGEEFKNSSPPSIQQLIQHIRDTPHVEPIEVLNRLQRVGVFPDVRVYNTLLDTCITSKHFQTAYQLFMEIKEPSSLVSPDVATYNIYMRGIIEAINSGGYVDIGMIDELLKEMRGREISPNVATFNTILEVCAISGDSCRAWEYFVMMQRDYRIEPDASTYGIIVKGIRTNDKVAHYFEFFFPSLLGFIANKTEAVEDALINGIIDICGKFACADKIEQMMDILKKKQRKLALVTYGKLITIYGQLRKPHKIDVLFHEIKKVDVQPNEVTYGCIMEAYLRCGIYEKVEEVYHEVQSCGKCACNIVIYTTLIRALAKKRDFNNVISLYARLKNDSKCKLNRIAYNALLDCCVKCGQYDKMSEIFEDMLKSASERAAANGAALSDEDAIEPDLITYSTLIKGMCKAGAMHKAIALYEEMKRKGLELDEVLFNSLLDGFVKCDYHTHESEKIISDMKKLKIKFSNYTYSILIKLYTKNRLVEKALGVLDEMKKNGVSPGVIVYTCLLQACIKNKMIDRAIEIFNDMKENKVQPDKTAYNTIVNGCVFSGKLLAACGILAQAMTDNIILHEDVYNNVLRNFLINHKMTPAQKHEHATAVCNYVKLHKIPVNEDYFQQVLHGLVFTQPQMPMHAHPQSHYYGYYQPQGYYYYQPYYQGGYAGGATQYQQTYARRDGKYRKQGSINDTFYFTFHVEQILLYVTTNAVCLRNLQQQLLYQTNGTKEGFDS